MEVRQLADDEKRASGVRHWSGITPYQGIGYDVIQKRKGDHEDTEHLQKKPKWHQEAWSQSDDEDPFQTALQNLLAPVPCGLSSSESTDQSQRWNVTHNRKGDHQESEHLQKTPMWCQEAWSQSDDEDPFQTALRILVAPVPCGTSSSESEDQSQRGKVSHKTRNALGDFIPLSSSTWSSSSSSDGAQKNNVQKRGGNILSEKACGVSQKRKAEEQDSGHLHKKQRQDTEPQTQDDAQPSTSCARPASRKMKKLPYIQGPLLGEGGFGSVYAGTRISDGLQVAIKYVPKFRVRDQVEMEGQGSIPKEVALMRLVNSDPACSNILRLVEWFEQPTRYVMILERPDPCQDLSRFCKYSGQMDENLAKKVMKQLIGALKHCESRGVFHRDVKPQNILIRTDTQEIKLLDFGCGDFLKDSAYKTFAGTFNYTPPEWFSFRQYHARPATVWSLGVTLYKILCGKAPFSTRSQIIRCRLSIPSHLSIACHDLISRCLSARAAERPSLEDIERHPWFH